MKEKKVFIHIIDSLKRGGAETLLKNTIHILPGYDHLVIYFQKANDIELEFPSYTRFVCLEHRGWKDLFKTVIKLRRIIKKEDPYIINSHLFLSSLFARLATPRKVPLVNTLHSVYSIDAFNKNKKSLWAERLTLKKHHTLIAVSQFVLNDYLSFVPFSGKRYVLYNFLPEAFFEKKKVSKKHTGLKGIALGNLKEAKNYFYLLALMDKVKDQDMSLDIYGEGDLRNELQMIIEQKKLNVRLCAATNDIPGIFSDYDFFMQVSEHEGFGLSVIEAIAARLPMFISDIPVFREITNSHAHFLPLNNENEAAAVLSRISKSENLLYQHVEDAYEYSCSHFNQWHYKEKLLSIYNDIVLNRSC